MTIYDVTAWCVVPHYTTFEIEASTVNEALEKAKSQARDECGEPCDGGEFDWEEFEVTSDAESMRYLTPARATEIAAPELLDALRRGVNVAQDVVDFWERGDLAESVRALSLWLADARTAINQAIKPEEDKL